MNRKLAAALTGAALTLALAGCGDDNNAEELNAWAKTVCDSVKPQVANARQARDDMAQVKPDEKPADLQKRLSADINALAESNSELAKDIDKAGPPPVDNGVKLEKDAVRELRASAESYLDLKKQVDDLDTKNQARFAEGLRGVGEEIEKLRQRNDGALEKLQSGDVGRTMAKQRGCKSASSSPGLTGNSAE